MINKNSESEWSMSKTSSTANAQCLANMLAISAREVGNLHGLAKLAGLHSHPIGDGHHTGEELTSGAGNIHIGSDISVLLDTLLENPDAILVTTHCVVGVFH